MKQIKLVIDADIETGKLQISGPLDLRLLVCNVLAEAIKVVCNRPMPTHPDVIKPEPTIVLPNGNTIH